MKTTFVRASDVGEAWMQKLAAENEADFNIFVCMSTFVDNPGGRRKEFVKNIRTAYIECDADALKSVEEIENDSFIGKIPPPQFVLESSPGKRQIFWILDKGLTTVQQEDLNRALACRYSGDPACVDVVRVLRLPNFQNRKYPAHPVVKILQSGDGVRHSASEFKIAIEESQSAVKVPADQSELQSIAIYLEKALDESGIHYLNMKRWGSQGYLWELPSCVWAADHSTGDGGACIILHNSGALDLSCRHSSCKRNGRNWAHLRQWMEAKVGHTLQFGDRDDGAGVIVAPTSIEIEDIVKGSDTPQLTDDEIFAEWVKAGEIKKHPDFDMTPDEVEKQDSIGADGGTAVYKLYETPGPSLEDADFYGPLGEITKRICQYSEASPEVIYISLIVAFGNMMGRGPYFNIGATQHHANEYMAGVGETARARKGTASDESKAVQKLVDRVWATTRQMGGFRSPQAVISAIKDDSTFRFFNRKHREYEEKTTPGVTDKRLCINENELSALFKLITNNENNAAEMFRNGWDSQPLSNKVAGKTEAGEHNSLECREPHLSIIGFTTASQAKETLPMDVAGSGDGNRFLWVYIKRKKLIPEPPPPIDWSEETIEAPCGLIDQVSVLPYLMDMLTKASQPRLIPFANAAVRKEWARIYKRWENAIGKADTFLGGMTSRGPAHIRRIAMILALVDCSEWIDLPHLRMAEKIVSFSVKSARMIFMGVSAEQITIWSWAKDQPDGFTVGRDLHSLFGRNRSADWLRAQVVGMLKTGHLTFDGAKYRHAEPKKARQ